ncbi:MAG: ABC transporter ATP-binding protein/permease [Acidobacteria bacterium]|nr:ABC transporter ATP-binding protein/permease [Acidobacteriota bacterium]
MKIIWRYLEPYRGWIALALALAGLAKALALLDPLIFGWIIDRYVEHPGSRTESELVHGVLGLLALAIGIAIASRIARAFADYVTRLVVQRFGLQIFNDGLRHAIRLSFQEYEELRSGETLSLLQKVRADTERFVTSVVDVLFVSLVGAGFLVWFGVTRHWALVPVFLVGVLGLGGLTGLMSGRIKRLQRSIVRETARMAGAITESLRNIELVRSLGLARQEIGRLGAHTEAIYRLEMQKVRRVRTLGFLQGVALSLLKHSILFALLWLIFHRVLQTGELIAMQFISVQVFMPLQELGNVILFYREAEGSIAAFDAFMKRPIVERPEEPVTIGPLEELRFEDVVFRHRSAAQAAVDGLSFTLRAGDTVAFVGPSGSGKSTLVKLLVGLYRPVSGRILVNGVPSTEIRWGQLRRQIGIVTQDTQLFAGTIRENLLFVASEATETAMREALERAAATGLIERSAAGLDTLLGEGGMRLSGGEKQRIALARALIRQPRLLILDEATSALDSLTELEIGETLREISERRELVLVMIAHRLSTVLHADTIHVLEKGRIVESGTHDELVAARGLYYAMWRQQIGERDPRSFGGR